MTRNQKHAGLIAAARVEGAATGAMCRQHGWPDQTMQRAAVGYVNRLPLNDVPLERELVDAYLAAAREARGRD